MRFPFRRRALGWALSAVLGACAGAPPLRTSGPLPPTAIGEGLHASADAGAASASTRDPRFEALVTAGREACLAKQWAAALSALDQAVALAPDDVEARRWRGHAHTGAEQPAAAFDDLEHALRHGADDPWTHYARAMALHNLGRLEEALRGYSDALAIDASFYKAYEWRGFTNARLGRPVAALPDLDLALTLDRGNPWLSAIRGKVRASLLDLAGAEEDLWRAVDADGQDADAVAQLGYLLATGVNVDQGMAMLERAVQIASERQVEARAWLVVLLRRKGRDEAVTVHLQALRATSSPWLQALAGFLDGRLDGAALLAAAAAPAVESSIDERPARRVAAWLHRGLAAERAGATAEAIDAYARAIASGRSEQWEWTWAMRRLAELTGERTR